MPSALFDDSAERAAALMADFATRTGFSHRYLWTDAFAVCNFLSLGQISRAAELIDSVHQVLGQFRPDDDRRGWLSGLPEHPTLGGLRIGKPLPERALNAAPDERLEWNQDGQYFHYLTRWIHALDQTARWSHDRHFHSWARELMAAAHRAFTYRTGAGELRMFWKMRTDLSQPLVDSMGQHDALDGYLTCLELDASSRFLGVADGTELSRARSEFAEMVSGSNLVTMDALGMGGLLVDAFRAAQLLRADALPDRALLVRLIRDARASLDFAIRASDWDGPASERLAFRELGLAIGLRCVPRLAGVLDDLEELQLRSQLRDFEEQELLADRLIYFWSHPQNHRGETWPEHRDINEVMLATALVPVGYTALRGLGGEVTASPFATWS